MTLFKYKALSEVGKKIVGIVEADDHLQAKEKLKRQKMIITDLFPLRSKYAFSPIPKNSILQLTQEIARLLKAGLPLYESILTLEEKYRGTQTHTMILDLCDQIKRGNSFSSAISKHPKNFPPIYISMITNAENMGSLTATLEEISILLSKQEKLKKQLVSALIYPAILSFFCFFVLCSLLFFVIPSLSELFEGKNLHPLTKVVLAASAFANAHQGTLLISILLGIFFLVLCFISTAGKKIVYHALFYCPVIKHLIVKVALIRFSRALSSLLKGGVPFIKALKLSNQVMGHPILEQEIEKACDKVIEGESFSSFLKKSPYFPQLFSRLVSVAEESGNLESMLYHISLIYEEELEKSLLRLTTILQPVLLLLLGFIVGIVLLSVLLPLTDVNSFVSG